MPYAPIFFDDATLDAWLQEDIGYFDLTSTVLGVTNETAKISWLARDPITVACSEEVARLVQRQGGVIKHLLPSGTRADKHDAIVEATGPAQALLNCWKVAQNLLEYACAVATRTRVMHDLVREIRPDMGILTTRKHPPGLRRVAQKAAIAGGALPHRLGLSETLLIFPQHRALLKNGWDDVKRQITAQKNSLIEKKIVIEAETLEEAITAVEVGAEIIQFDKVSPTQLQAWSPLLRTQFPAIKLLAAGGIKQTNVQDYAASGVDAVVTSSLYFGPPADIGVSIKRMES